MLLPWLWLPITTLFAAIVDTIVTAVAAAAATACLRFAAVSTAVRSCCSDMLLCVRMLLLLPFLCSFLLQLSAPRRVVPLAGVFTHSARTPHVLRNEN